MDNFKDILDIQLADDYCCTPDEVRSKQNVFTVFSERQGRRRYENSPFLQMACVHGKLLVTGDKEVVPIIKECVSDVKPEWAMDMKTLRKIDGIVAEFGYEIGTAHPLLIPGGLTSPTQVQGDIKWYGAEDIEAFRDDDRFCYAYTFNPNAPDVIGVSLSRNGKILGMAGASKDSERMYQIGINADPDVSGERIATHLVTLLKNRIIDMGILPFYSTAQSHIGSLNVGICSGFRPAWAELYTRKK